MPHYSVSQHMFRVCFTGMFRGTGSSCGLPATVTISVDCPIARIIAARIEQASLLSLTNHNGSSDNKHDQNNNPYQVESNTDACKRREDTCYSLIWRYSWVYTQ